MNTKESTRLVKYGSKLFRIVTLTAISNIQLEGVGEMFILVKTTGDLFRYGTLSKVATSALSISANDFILRTLPKKILYGFPVQNLDIIRIKVASEDRSLFKDNEDALMLIEETPVENQKVETYGALGEIDMTGTSPDVLVSSLGTSDFTTNYHQYSNKKKRFTWKDKFPLFRQPFISIFWGNKLQAIDLIFERVQKRFQSGRNLDIVPASVVVTPNLDHLRLLIEENDSEFQEVYAHAFMQTTDGHPPLVRFAKESIGFPTTEQVSGVDIFMSIMNKIGSETLPYTVYFVGGFQNTAQKVKDYFVQSYPHMAANIVGISAPPIGFLNNQELLNTIFADIDKKKPDFIFACLSTPTPEKFILRMKKAGVNFGLGFGFGRTFDLISGYQKKEPQIIEDLHLVWLYRPFTNKAYAKRVYKDLLFALRSVLGS